MYGKREVCVCGASIRMIELRGFHGFVHEEPLGKLRVSATEAGLIHAEPPRAGEPLHRETFLHQPRPVAV